jgi:hypothetical protein
MNNFELPFKKENIRIILIGLVVNIIGYLLMIGGGSEDPNQFDANELFSHTRITIAPLLIVTGFVIILWGIMKKAKK